MEYPTKRPVKVHRIGKWVTIRKLAGREFSLTKEKVARASGRIWSAIEVLFG